MAKFDEVLRYPVTVQWGDQDAFGHLNNVLYLRYFESARIAYMGGSRWLDDEALKPIVATVKANYLRQVRFPATLQLFSSVVELRPKGLTLATLFLDDATGEPVAECAAVTLSFDFKKQRVVPMPEHVVEHIKEVEKYQVPEIHERLKKNLLPI